MLLYFVGTLVHCAIQRQMNENGTKERACDEEKKKSADALYNTKKLLIRFLLFLV